MTNMDIKGLLDKYYAGTSSIADETALKEYFNGSYDDSMESHAGLFKAFRQEAAVTTEISYPNDVELFVVQRTLDKYWDCTSSLEDEQYLKTYFTSNKVHESLLDYRALFKVLDTEAKIVTGELKSDINTAPTQASKPKIFALSKRWMAVAASLFLGMMFWLNFDTGDTLQADGQIDISHLSAEEQEAYEVTVEALAFLSGKLDKSSNSIGMDFKKVANANIFK